MNLFFNTLILLSSLIILNFFSLYWNGGYFEGIMYALLGGFGNTVPALIALVASVIGILRSYINNNSVISFISGKFLSILLFILTLFAIFTNGVLVYLKFQNDLYVNILGSAIFEIIIVTSFAFLFFVRKSKK